MTFDNRKLRYGGGAILESRRPKNLRRAAARRTTKPGYPVDTPFKSRSEVDEYFSDTQIICLRCGRPFLRLAIHLPKIHGMTEDQYRHKYGIPLGRGLVCAPTKERYVAAREHTLLFHPELNDHIRSIQPSAVEARAHTIIHPPQWLIDEYTVRAKRMRKPKKF